jgi:hypothetical protein
MDLSHYTFTDNEIHILKRWVNSDEQIEETPEEEEIRKRTIKKLL